MNNCGDIAYSAFRAALHRFGQRPTTTTGAAFEIEGTKGSRLILSTTVTRNAEAAMTACSVPATRGIHQSWEYESLVPCGIVVGVDGSSESLAALNTAATIARSRRCALHVVSVIPPFPSYQIDPGADESQRNIEDLRIQLRESSIRDMLHAAGAEKESTYQVVMGRPAKMLVRIAEQRGADLILVGRRKHGVMDRIMGGETTLQVMRLASIPVLAIPADLEGPHSIVVATDFSAPSVRAAKVAIDLLGKSGTLYLVYVEPPVDLLPEGFTLLDETHDAGNLDVWFRRLIESLRAPEGVIVEPIVLNGKPVPAVLEFAEKVGASMIAAGSHGHSRMERFLLGSVATGFVRNAACPVLVSPSGD